MKEQPFDVDDVILNFDPLNPQSRFLAAGLGLGAETREAALPKPIPWPTAGVPTAKPLTTPPLDTDDLSGFAGYDAVVVTWTAAEASALAQLFTPGFTIEQWYEYRHDVDDYIPLVTGAKAPFNSTDPEMKRYYQSLGLYFPCTIGSSRVLLFKSGLHLAYDGPATPVRRLMNEIATAVSPRMFVTTGTGGGIGQDIKLGDVVIAGTVKFDCKQQFKNEPWAAAVYRASQLPAGAIDQITPALTGVNAAKIPNARANPKIFCTADDAVVTTDFFAFDDSTDYYKLQGLGQACDMGDAMIALSLQSFDHIDWFSVKNASDPQIANTDNDIEQAARTAASIYARYGGLTTAASVIATWAIIYTAASVRHT